MTGQAKREPTQAEANRAKIEQAMRGAQEMGLAHRDAILLGVGYLLVRPDGIERIDPSRVIVKPERKPDAE